PPAATAGPRIRPRTLPRLPGTRRPDHRHGRLDLDDRRGLRHAEARPAVRVRRRSGEDATGAAASRPGPPEPARARVQAQGAALRLVHAAAAVAYQPHAGPASGPPDAGRLGPGRLVGRSRRTTDLGSC